MMMNHLLFVGMFCSGWLAVAAENALTVRVMPTRGGPQIHVNGKPIAPRFFWGAMNGGHVRLGEAWTDQSFEFCPGLEVPRQGTLHFRFGQLAGKIDLADVRVRDAQTGEDILPLDSFAKPEVFARTWNIWPPPPANTVGKWEISDGALHVTLDDPPGGHWPDFHFHSSPVLGFRADRTYRCTFRAKALPARVIQPALYQVANNTWKNIGGPPGAFLSQVALARDAGVNLVSFSAPECWDPPETPVDWSPIDSLCRRIVAVNPNVLLVPRVGADAPGWWLERHPQACMVYDQTRVRPDHASVSDRAYRADAAAHLEQLCRHLCEAFPRHFAGIHPCGQNTGEWFYQDSWERPLSGYDAATLAAFRIWLKSRGDRDAETATVPTDTERRGHPFGLLRDPAREKRLIEFARFQQTEMADHVAALATACRRGTAGKKLVVFFYGYVFEFGALPNGAPTSGHYALSRLLSGKDIDILCSPISYTDREWLGTAPCMSAAESVRQAGILWLNEDDSRTFLDPRKAEHVQEGGLVDLEQTQQVMLRNTSQAALRGFGSWWMDLPAQGWFNDARIWQEMVRLRPVDVALLRRSQPFTPNVAMITEEDSMCHLTGDSAVAAQPLTYHVRADFGRMGAPYGQYLLADVLAGKVPAKLQVFLSAWALSSDQRRALAASRSAATTRVWCWAPGFIYPDRQEVAGISAVTGFRARPVSLPAAEVTPTEEGLKRGLVASFGPRAAIEPLFAVEARPEETWATYADGSAAVAVRRRARGVSSSGTVSSAARTFVADAGWDVFVGTPRLTPELLRAVANLAGVHLFTETNVPVWVAEGYLAIQAHAAGPITVDVGQAVPVFDALDNKPLGRGPRVRVPFNQGETRVLRY
jgi:beta-galactosidase